MQQPIGGVIDCVGQALLSGTLACPNLFHLQEAKSTGLSAGTMYASRVTL